MAVVEVGSARQFEELLHLKTKSLLVAHFWAPRAPQCVQMNVVMAELAKEHPHVSFVKLEAEAVTEVSERCEISYVPTFLFFKNSQKVDCLDGAPAPELTKAVQRHMSSGSFPPGTKEHLKEDFNLRLRKLTYAAPRMLFIGNTSRTAPVVSASRRWQSFTNTVFSSAVFLSSQTWKFSRSSKQSNWPTCPQLYVSGELIGGLDIIKELEASEELDIICPKAPKLEERLKVPINQASVMLFMKGNKQEEKCGLSKQILEMLKSIGIECEAFGMPEDEGVPQGLKMFSNWPTHPQLYVRGGLVGGLEIAKELKGEN